MSSWSDSVIWWQVYPLGFVGAEKQALPAGSPVRHRLLQLLDWLDYLIELGCNGLALNPVFASESHGYDIVDHFSVDPRLGDDADVDQLIAACHDRGIRVLFDGVFNHVGRAFPGFADVIAQGRDSEWADWFHIDWEDADAHDGFGYRTFEGHGGLVALNHDSPAVADYVVSVMTSNNALLRPKLFTPIKHLLYRDHLNDLRPTWLPKLMAHVGGTTAEFIVPTVLVFFAGDQPWRWFLIGFMVVFHLNIISNLPMGVPLEWNVFFIFSLFYLFGHYGSIRATDLSSPLLLALVVVVVAIVIAGNMFPEKISFLPAMRYYAGNWATSLWCFRAGAEEKVDAQVVKSSALVVNQLARLYDPETAEIMADKVAAFRAMHIHGRALNGLLPRAIGNEADYKVREGEIVAGPLVGWNFGEGHLHNEQLLEAVQRRCHFEDGDLRVIVLEGQPIHIQKQWYRILDAKTGLIEAGYVTIEDMASRQPWPEPGDEFPVHLTTQPVVHGES